MQKIIPTLVLIALMITIISEFSYASEEVKKPWLWIPFTCEENFPESSRTDYDRTQYQAAYDMCKGKYDEYTSLLESFVNNIKHGYGEGKSRDWESAKDNLQEMEKIISDYWRILIWYGGRNTLLGNLSVWKSEVNQKIDEAKLKEAQIYWSNKPQVAQWTESTYQSWSAIVNNSWSSIVTTPILECKKWFIFNKKSKRCRKLFKAI